MLVESCSLFHFCLLRIPQLISQLFKQKINYILLTKQSYLIIDSLPIQQMKNIIIDFGKYISPFILFIMAAINHIFHFYHLFHYMLTFLYYIIFQIIQKQRIFVEMKYSKNKNLRGEAEEQNFQEKVGMFKKTFYSIVYEYLKENFNQKQSLYYIILILEHLALLWHVIHPTFNLYNSTQLIQELRLICKVLNFYEYISNDPYFQNYIIGACSLYMISHVCVIVASAYLIVNKKDNQFLKLLKKIVNYQILINTRVLFAPFLGLSINILYCSSLNPYRISNVCYDASHIVYCLIVGLIALIILLETAICVLYYFAKSPFKQSPQGQYQRYYIISKSLIKLFIPIVFLLDYEKNLLFIEMCGLTVSWGLYIFWHRIFSIHSYNQKYFYVQYCMQGALFWLSLNNIYFNQTLGQLPLNKLDFIFAVFSSILFGLTSVSIEKQLQKKFFQECIYSKSIKKQNMQRFLLILINKCMSPLESINIKIYKSRISQIMVQNLQLQVEISNDKEDEMNEHYKFLCLFIDSLLKQNNSITFKILKCQLLCLLGKKSYGYHATLQLQQKKFTITDDFMVYQLKINEKIIYDEEQLDKNQLVKLYDYYQKFQKLQVLINHCAFNNLEYWDQLSNTGISLAKLKNLATNYTKLHQKIVQNYTHTIELYPENLTTLSLYFNYIFNISSDVKQAKQIQSKLFNIIQKKGAKKMSGFQVENHQPCIITLDTIGNNLGTILNCNNEMKQIFGYEKEDAIHKNITQLMPKIYAEFHNTFMLNFLKKQSHEYESRKIVYGLSKNAFLIEMNIAVKIMFHINNSLVIAGFINKTEQIQENGTIIILADTREIIGIDNQLYQLCHHKINGKQIQQEQLKVQTLIPQFNLEKLQKLNKIKMGLVVGNNNLNQEGVTQKLREIWVEIKSSQLYGGKQLVFLKVTINNLEYIQQDIRIKHISRNQRKSQIILKQIMDKLCSSNRLQDVQNINMINQSVSLMPIQQNQPHYSSALSQNINKQIIVSYKIQEFVVRQQNSRLKIISLMVLIIFFIIVFVLLLYSYFTYNSYLQNMKTFYSQMNTTTLLAPLSYRINYNTQLIWSMEKNILNQNAFSIFPILQRQMSTFHIIFRENIFNSAKYKESLLFNDIPNKIFLQSYINGNNIVTVQRDVNIGVGINAYISSVSRILDQEFIQKSNNRNTILVNAMYIQKNGEKIIPQISLESIRLFEELFVKLSDAQYVRKITLKSLAFSTIIICLLIIAFIGNYIFKLNRKVVNLYNQIRLWDINELSLKCYNFLNTHGTKKKIKKRSSSILNIFPLKIFVDIIQSQKRATSKKIQTRSQIERIKIKKSIKLQNYQISYLSPDPLLNSGFNFGLNSVQGNEGNEDEDACLNGQKEVQKKVVIEWNMKNTNIIIGIITISLIFALMFHFSSSLMKQAKKVSELHTKRLKMLGFIQKNILYVDLLTYKLIINTNKTQTSVQLKKEIEQFYYYSDQTYSYLGDPNTVMKNVYSSVETANQWLGKTNLTNDSNAMGNYSILRNNLIKGFQQIQQLNLNLFRPQFQRNLHLRNLIQLIFTILIIMLLTLIELILYYKYLQPNLQQSSASLNMIKIIPIWVYQRNTATYQLFKK